MRCRAVILAAALASLISIESAEAKLDILVDKATQRMLVIQDGYIRYMWPVSTGRDSMATPNGVYAPQRLERNWFSAAYYDSPMPFSIFFYKGYAIHGSYAIDRLGGPASHGCVRLHPRHAAVLFDLVQQEGPNNTTIEVSDEGRPAEPPAPGREIAAGPGVNPPVPAAGPGMYPPVPVAGPGVNPPVPRSVYYREAGDMPDPPPAPLGNRLIAARNALPLRPVPAPVGRRMLTEVRPPANIPRPPSGAGEADTANGSPRPSNELSEPRSKPKAAERSPPEHGQQAPSTSNFKLLPASCWSGGASRWKWWASSQGTSCR
jgi:hypothetical protein